MLRFQNKLLVVQLKRKESQHLFASLVLDQVLRVNVELVRRPVLAEIAACKAARCHGSELPSLGELAHTGNQGQKSNHS